VRKTGPRPVERRSVLCHKARIGVFPVPHLCSPTGVGFNIPRKRQLLMYKGYYRTIRKVVDLRTLWENQLLSRYAYPRIREKGRTAYSPASGDPPRSLRSLGGCSSGISIPCIERSGGQTRGYASCSMTPWPQFYRSLCTATLNSPSNYCRGN